jgi:hypothetical protein
MRRVLADLVGFGLLIGILYFHVMPFGSNLVILLSVPILVGYGRGFVERKFLRPVPLWLGALEWTSLILLGT